MSNERTTLEKLLLAMRSLRGWQTPSGVDPDHDAALRAVDEAMAEAECVLCDYDPHEA